MKSEGSIGRFWQMVEDDGWEEAFWTMEIHGNHLEWTDRFFYDDVNNEQLEETIWVNDNFVVLDDKDISDIADACEDISSVYEGVESHTEEVVQREMQKVVMLIRGAEYGGENKSVNLEEVAKDFEQGNFEKYQTKENMPSFGKSDVQTDKVQNKIKTILI